MKFIIDERLGVHNRDEEFFHLKQGEVLGLLDKLDGERHTLLCVERDDGWIFFVGGGAELYVVNKTSPDGINYEIKSDFSGDCVDLCVGGQYGDYDPSSVVRRELARLALFDFCGFCRFSEANWHEIN
ncbi:hypothetical protein ACI6Q5_22080 [Xanthomonas codiaei]|uniref:Uncharacterized protein n=1 Tax=Xanthomonas codiaei TaxID=56463 RepID=A0ABW9MTL6_9XANT|nr:hypothetical protein [Xanthomonas codiaei]